jgi:hypothetical protein
MTNTGPLVGVKVIELGGIGPGPHAATVLADVVNYLSQTGALSAIATATARPSHR